MATTGMISRKGIGRAGIVSSDLLGFVGAGAIGLVAATFLSPGLAGTPIADSGKLVSDRIATFLPALAVFLHMCAARNHYSGRVQFWDEIRGVATATFFAAVAEGFLQYAAKEDGSRLWTFFGWALLPFCVVAARTACKLVLLRRGLWSMPVLVVGRQYEASMVADALLSDPLMGYELAGVHDGSGDVASVVVGSGAVHVFLALSESSDGCFHGLARGLSRAEIPYSIAVPPLGLANTLTRSSFVFGHDIMFLQESAGLARPFARIVKRQIDVFGSLLLLVLASPVLLAAAAAPASDGGSPFYGHKRVGRNGKEFVCMKFRTMRKDSDEVLRDLLATCDRSEREWRTTGKLSSDPRVTRWGAVLRRTSVDELPQLANVLKGEMSLVGPRPVTRGELSEHYADEDHVYGMARPGMTGLWQASGRNEIGYVRRVAMDGWYVRNWSIWLDCVLVMKTIPALLSRRGAS